MRCIVRRMWSVKSWRATNLEEKVLQWAGKRERERRMGIGDGYFGRGGG